MARITHGSSVITRNFCVRQARARGARMSIMKRADEASKMSKYPWMNTAADEPIDDQAAKEITLDRVQRIGREYLQPAQKSNDEK